MAEATDAPACGRCRETEAEAMRRNAATVRRLEREAVRLERNARMLEVARRAAFAEPTPEEAEESRRRRLAPDALAGVPADTLAKMVAAKPSMSGDLRGLLISALADPGGGALWGLVDWVQKRTARPAGIEVDGLWVSVDAYRSATWWRRVAGMWRWNNYIAEWVASARKRRGGHQWGYSLAEVCAFTEAEWLAARGMGPTRVKELVAWLAGHGLKLRGTA